MVKVIHVTALEHIIVMAEVGDITGLGIDNAAVGILVLEQFSQSLGGLLGLGQLAGHKAIFSYMQISIAYPLQ